MNKKANSGDISVTKSECKVCTWIKTIGINVGDRVGIWKVVEVIVNCNAKCAENGGIKFKIKCSRCGNGDALVSSSRASLSRMEYSKSCRDCIGKVKFFDEFMYIRDLCETFSVDETTVSFRMKNGGMSLEDALITPVRQGLEIVKEKGKL